MSKSLGQLLHHPRRAAAVRRRDCPLLHAAHALPQPASTSATTSLDDARTALRRLYTALDTAVPGRLNRWIGRQPAAAAFQAAMDDDFNTPGAVAVLFELAAEVNRSALGSPARGLLKSLGAVLGVLQQAPRGLPARPGTADCARRRSKR